MKQNPKRLSKFLTIILCIVICTVFPAVVSAAEANNASIKVEAYNGNTATNINTLFPWFKITNTGNAPIPLKDISARYYYTIDGNKPQKFWCDWCSKGDTGMVSGKFVTISSSQENIDTYFEVSFNNENILLQPGESVEVHIRIAKEDWSDYNQGNDYSFNGSANTYVAQDKIPGFINGNIAWGNNPVAVVATGIQLDRRELTLDVSDTAVLNATILPSNATNSVITWYSSNTQVAEVNSNGQVKGISEGTAVITASIAGGDIKDSCKVNVISATSRGSLEGMIKDAVTHTAIPGAEITLYKKTTQGYEKTVGTVSDTQGLYKISLPVGEYKAVVTKENYIAAVNYLKIQQGITTYSPELQIVGDEYAGIGRASGIVKNAFNGLGVDGLSIRIRQGINSVEGEIVGTAVTKDGGKYSVDLPGGNYTAEVSGNNYITGYFEIISIGGRTTDNQDGVITPVIKRGQTRIVLTWGSQPKDLDSHLTGVLPDSSPFHTFYKSKQAYYANVKYADLDLDDTTSYGPETTTIYEETDGTYAFYVHDFTNRTKTSSTALSASGAQVKVYREDSLLETFNVPVNQGGTLWTVFTMKDGIITPINRMTYESNDENVGQQDVEGVWMEGAKAVSVQLGDYFLLPGTVKATSTLETVTLTIAGIDGYFDTTDLTTTPSSTFALAEFAIDTKAAMNRLKTYENPFSKPGNYTIRVWAKAAGMEAKKIGEIPVTVVSPAEITVTGVLAPKLKSNNFDASIPVETPLEGFTVKVMTRSGQQEKLLATAITESDGSFTATFKNDSGSVDKGYNIFLRLELNDKNAKIVKQIQDNSGEIIGEEVYKWDSNVIENVNYYKVDFGTLHPSSSDEIDKAFFLWNAVKDARNFYINNTKDHFEMPPIKVECTPNIDDGMWTNFEKIHIGTGGAYDYTNVLHEYGHVVMGTHDAFPDGYDGVYDWCEPCNPITAYCEAWAEFFSSVVYGDPFAYMYTFPDGGYFVNNRETLEIGDQNALERIPRFDGSKEEYEKNARVILSICGTFWDLYDDNNDTGNDIVALPFSVLDEVMRSKCETFTDFYNKLFSMGFARGQEEAIWRVIDDIGMAHDVTLPTIEMDWDLVTFTDNYLIQMTAKDDVAVKAVEWYLDDQLIKALYEGGWANIQHYILTITKGQLSDGIHKLKIVVMDCESFWYNDMRRDVAHTEKMLTLEVNNGEVINIY